MDLIIPLRRWSAVLLGGVLMLSLAACDSSSAVDIPGDETECTIDASLLADGGVGKDGIPALTDPEFISASEVTFLNGSNRVIGLLIDGQPVAVPHNILWWHEIINFNFAGLGLASAWKNRIYASKWPPGSPVPCRPCRIRARVHTPWLTPSRPSGYRRSCRGTDWWSAISGRRQSGSRDPWS